MVDEKLLRLPFPRHYLINPDHTYRAAKDLNDWMEHVDEAWARVAYTEFDHGNIYVSTVFLGLDHRFYGEGPPIVFESMIFGPYGGNEQMRYSTWEEAEKGHALFVAEVEERLKRLGPAASSNSPEGAEQGNDGAK